MKKFIILIFAVLALAAILNACKSSETKTGIANPASEYCVKQGGTLSILNEPQGQKGICKIPSGEVCEEWAYYRKECPSSPRYNQD